MVVVGNTSNLCISSNLFVR